MFRTIRNTVFLVALSPSVAAYAQTAQQLTAYQACQMSVGPRGIYSAYGGNTAAEMASLCPSVIAQFNSAIKATIPPSSPSMPSPSTGAAAVSAVGQ